MRDDITLRDVVTRSYVGVSESDSVTDAAAVMCDEEVDVAVVLRGSQPIGVFTGADALALAADERDLGVISVSDAMSPVPATMSPDRDLRDAAAEMTARDAGVLVVVEDDEVVGVVDATDVVAATASFAAREPGREPPSENGERGRVDDQYSDQSICEVCGTLTRGLANVNGQLVCADCREI